MSISYKRDDKFLFVCCDWEKYEDFFSSLDPIKKVINGKKNLIISVDKEKQLIKMINYLNMMDHAKNRKTQKKYHREDSDSDYEDYKTEEKTEEKTDRLAYFKSFANKDFVKSHKKDKKKEKDEEKSVKSYSSKSDEYSSSSYASSSSDDFPSPRSPKRKTKFSNEELYTMIEKMQKRMNLIEKILTKKLK